jgi:PAS domain-containing protein
MSQKQIYNAADSVNSLLGYWDLDLRCHAANAAYEVWFGRPPEEILGIPMNKLLGHSMS